MDRVVAIGLQRGRTFLVRLHADWPPLDKAAIGAAFETMDGQKILVPKTLAPAGGEASKSVTAEIDGLLPRIRPKVVAGLAARSSRRDLVIEIPPGQHFIRRLVLTVTAEGKTMPVAWPTQAALNQRMPASDEEYRASFTFRRGRHADPETMMQAAADCVAWRLAAEEPVAINVAYTCNAFVILAYKAMELGAGEFDACIEVYYPAMRELTEKIEEGKGVRENRYQQVISLQTVFWHYQIYKGNMEEFFNIGREIYTKYRKIKNFKLNYSNNLCTSLLFYAAAQYGRGERWRSSRNLKEVVAIFRRAAAIETRRLDWFCELAISYQAAYLALKALADIRKQKYIAPETLDEINRHCVRVQTPAFLARSLAFLTDMKPPAEG